MTLDAGALTLVGDVIDLKLPWLAGYSRQAAALVRDAGRLSLRFTNDTQTDEPHELIILTGANGAFCAGYDLKSAAQGSGLRYEPEGVGPIEDVKKGFGRETVTPASESGTPDATPLTEARMKSRCT